MEGKSRTSNKNLLLQVWCGLLTLAMVVMASVIASIKLKSNEASTGAAVGAHPGVDSWIAVTQLPGEQSVTQHTSNMRQRTTEDEVAMVKPNHLSPKGAPFKPKGSTLSYIQLINSSDSFIWDESLPKCDSCSLVLRNNSIHCAESGIYFMYVQVPFRKDTETQKTKTVALVRSATHGKKEEKQVEGIFPSTTETVWLAKIVRLERGDSVILNVSEEYLTDQMFWGAYQLYSHGGSL